MDRINKFLNSARIKKKKTIKVNGCRVELNKEDIKKVKRYLNSECLDKSIDLCPQMNTKYSSVPLDKPILEPKKSKIMKIQRNIRIMRKKEETPESMGTTVWKIAKECKSSAEILTNGPYDGLNPLSSYTFTENDLNEYYKELESRYKKTPIRMKKIEIDKFKSKTPLPQKEAKVFSISNAEVIGTESMLFRSSEEGKYDIFDLKRGIVLNSVEGKSALYSGEDLFVLKSKKVITHNIYGKMKRIEPIPEIVHPSSKRHEADCFDINKHFIAIAIGNGVNLFHRQQQKIFRVKLHKTSKVAINENNLYTIYNNILYITNINTREQKLINPCNDFTIGREVIAVASGENLIIHNRKMDQGDIVKYVTAHPSRPLICATTPTDIRIFTYEKTKEKLLVKLCRRIEGRFGKPTFHEIHPWIYAIKNGKLCLYT